MNPFDVGESPIDVRAVAVWNAENARSQRDYTLGDVLLDTTCRTCTEAATCWRCRSKARGYLKVATSQTECAQLLTIIERGSPAAPKCGTPGGYKAHRRRGEDACGPCIVAHSAYGRERRERRGA